MMEFGITMSLIGVSLISIALGMLIQRYFQDSEEAETRKDS